MDPSSLGALRDLACWLFRQGEHGQAEHVYAERKAPPSVGRGAHYTLGLVLHTTHSLSRAVVCAKAVGLKAGLRSCPRRSEHVSAPKLRRPRTPFPISKGVGTDQDYADAGVDRALPAQATGRIEGPEQRCRDGRRDRAEHTMHCVAGPSSARSFLPATLTSRRWRRSFRRPTLFRSDASCCVLHWQEHWMMTGGLNTRSAPC